ncbi:MAG: SLC13 family permease [Kiritimatiellales bacterium]
MLIPIIIFLITYAFIASEKVDKTIAAILGAGAVIMFHQIPYEEALHLVDLNVIFLLIGMMVIVSVLSSAGLFEWIAIKLARIAKGEGLPIIAMLLLATAVLSAFLDNVTTVILIAPITILLAQILEINAVPILVLEAVFSNIGGTATLVGDPPNILIGSQTSLSFNDFLLNLAPVILIVLLASLIVTHLVLHRSVKTTKAAKERIMKSKPELAIIDPVLLKKGLIVFGLVLAGFFAGRALNIEPGIVALSGAVLMILICRADVHHALVHVEWNTILFFVGLFMLIGSLEVKGVFESLGELVLHLCGGNLLLTVIVVLWFSAIASAVVDNIPLVMAMIPLVKSIVPVFAQQMALTAPEQIHVQIAEPLLWALALGACLGGNGSLVGASANVVIAQIARRNNYTMSFWQFTRFGFPFMILSLVISSLYLWLRYF